MTGSELALLLASLLVAIPAVRSAYNLLSARRKRRLADKQESRLPLLTGQERQTATLEIELLRNAANDLVEFSALIPNWALYCGLLGILLNLAGRAIPIFLP